MVNAGHGGGRPVVGDGHHDGVARTAVGAVGERVAVPAVGRVVHLGQAVVARAGVDADRDVGVAVAALRAMTKRPAAFGRRARPSFRRSATAVNGDTMTPATRARAGLSTSRRHSSAMAPRGPAPRSAPRRCRCARSRPGPGHGVPVDERPEAHPLDGARHPQPAALHRVDRGTGHQQMRGRGSPTSMSTIRVPPKAVSSTTIPGGSARTSPMRAAVAPSGWARRAARAASASSGGDHGDELALVGHVERVDAEQVAGPVDRRVAPAARPRRGRRPGWWPGQLVAHRPHAAPGRVAHPAGRRGGGQEVSTSAAERGRVGAEVGFEGQVAPGQHDRHPVIGDGP